MRKIVLITLLISVFGSVNAQSLDDLRQKAYEAAIEAVNKGKTQKSAYEEYLERQELEAAKKAEEERKAEEEAKKAEEEKYWEAIDILHRCVLCEPINKNIFVKCYCYAIDDFIWYYAFIGTDDNIWVSLFYDNNGEIGEIFYSDKIQSREPISATESTTGIKTPALKMTLTSGDLIFIQDLYDPYSFAIAW